MRDAGFSGDIILLGDEVYPPYERPPLSKAVLADKTLAGSTHLAGAEALREKRIDWRPATRVIAIDRVRQAIALEAGGEIFYDRLLLTTGGRSRPLTLPGSDMTTVLYLRSIDDAELLHDALVSALPVLIIGGGWIGLEIAAAARKRDLRVTVVEAAHQLCARALPPEAGAILDKMHREAGVDLHLNCVVTAIDGQDAPTKVTLSDGSVVPAGIIVAGIGMIPNTELAEQAGLAVDNGILVDPNGRTSDPHIFAAGDVARFLSPSQTLPLRLESWNHAQNHGIAVAKAMLGETAPYEPIPWFWSDQYGLNLQMAGLPAPSDTLVTRGDPAGQDGTMFFLRDGRMTAAISFNRGRENGIARRLLKQNLPVAPAILADESADLRAALR
jgi:3-phenylpropionate/trans-cinnamate dioxygenase ferredoxin reductase subunit